MEYIARDFSFKKTKRTQQDLLQYLFWNKQATSWVYKLAGHRLQSIEEHSEIVQHRKQTTRKPIKRSALKVGVNSAQW